MTIRGRGIVGRGSSPGAGTQVGVGYDATGGGSYYCMAPTSTSTSTRTSSSTSTSSSTTTSTTTST
eukprot:750277-Hanusia_phi.AAC.3